MKVYLALSILLLAVCSSFGQVKKGTSTASSAYKAIVSENEATFSFPIRPGQKYEWCSGGVEYEWSSGISVANGDRYSIGLSIVTPQGASICESGNIAKVLRSGQFGLWKETPDGGFGIDGLTENGFAGYENTYSNEFFIERFRITGSASTNLLTIKIVGPKTLAILFADKPKHITMVSQIGLGAVRRKVSIPVKYVIAVAQKPAIQPSQAPAPTACMDTEGAIGLLREHIPEEPVNYTIEEAISYKPHESLTEVREYWPLAALLHDYGYIALDAPGYVFHEITAKGRALNQRFPNGIPLADKSISSIDKIRCVGKKLRIEFTYNVVPTTIAKGLFGNSMFRIRALSSPWKSGIEFTNRAGKWVLIQESRPYLNYN